jgi:hypothetical protein
MLNEMNKMKRLFLFFAPPVAKANTSLQVTSYNGMFNIGSHHLTLRKTMTSSGKPIMLELPYGSLRAKS